MAKSCNKQGKTNKFALLWYSHPRIAIALMLVGLNLAVIFVFTAILSVISGNPFFDELAYIFTFTMSADGIYDFVNNVDDVACFVVKILLTVVQMVIFSGALIGFTTDLLQSTIDKRINNLGKISLSGHYVFLNWSSIGAHVIYDLSFLEGNKNVVILTEEDRDEVLNSIQNIFIENNVKMKNIRIFIKNGSPSSPKHLADVSLDKARYVGILLANLPDDGTHAMSGNDVNALKSLFNVIHVAKNANVVVEAENGETVSKIEQLLDTIDSNLHKRIIVFSHNSVIGHILGKTIVNPAYATVYHDLLSYDGCEFYGIEPMDIDQALYTYNDCIPIINYDDDDVVDANGNAHADQLYVLSDNRQTLGLRAVPQSYALPLNYNANVPTPSFTVFVLSHSGNSRFVEDEMAKFEKQFGADVTCFAYSYNDNLDEVAKAIAATQGNKKILLLSSDQSSSNQDEDIFLSAMALKLSGCMDDNTEIFAEISNPSNLNSLKNFGIMSVIVSNRIISLFMVQLLTHPGSKKFYRDLISTNDDNGSDSLDLDIVRVGDVLHFDGPSITFDCKSQLVQSIYFASDKQCMCIGVKYNGSSNVLYLCDQMDKAEKLTLRASDELILIKY
ncbi:MAG: hypothetical protein IKC47_02315 [Clostridia bacterium]|nr:hypothetical protein [Clostridia bacterium]